MESKMELPLSEKNIWLLIGVVFLGVIVLLMAVFDHEKEKPRSPQAVAAAAFSQMLTIQEWKPGTGKQPLFYHPAALEGLQWRPLPERPAASQQPGSAPAAPPTGAWQPLGNQFGTGR